MRERYKDLEPGRKGIGRSPEFNKRDAFSSERLAICELIQARAIGLFDKANKQSGEAQTTISQYASNGRRSPVSVAARLIGESSAYLGEAYGTLPTQKATEDSHSTVERLAVALERTSRLLVPLDYAHQLITGRTPISDMNAHQFSAGMYRALSKSSQAYSGITTKLESTSGIPEPSEQHTMFISTGSFLDGNFPLGLPIIPTQGRESVVSPIAEMMKNPSVVTLDSSLKGLELELNRQLVLDGSRYALAKGIFVLLPMIDIPQGTKAQEVQEMLGLNDEMQFVLDKNNAIFFEYDESTGAISTQVVTLVKKYRIDSTGEEKLRTVEDPKHLAEVVTAVGAVSEMVDFIRYLLPHTRRPGALEKLNEALGAKGRPALIEEYRQYKRRLDAADLLIQAARGASRYQETESVSKVDMPQAITLLREVTGIETITGRTDAITLQAELFAEGKGVEQWVPMLFAIQQNSERGTLPSHILGKAKELYAQFQAESHSDNKGEVQYRPIKYGIMRFSMVSDGGIYASPQEALREFMMLPPETLEDAVQRLGTGIYEISVSSKESVTFDRKEGYKDIFLTGVDSKGKVHSVTIRRKLDTAEIHRPY